MIQELAPWFGYLATLLLALGLLVNNDIKFRWLNFSGNIAFIIYGVLFGAMPVILTNALLLCINIYFLFRIYNRKELFEILEFETGGIMVERFLQFYEDDIAFYFPAFKREQLQGNLNFVVLRDLVIANTFSTRLSENGAAEVILNYTVAKFRDYKVGRFIFEKEKQFLLSKGVKKIYYTVVANKQHEKFLFKMRFKKEIIEGNECLAKNLTD
ncbi:MAG: YgjV family protein [Chitinophagaceae bacterium]